MDTNKNFLVAEEEETIDILDLAKFLWSKVLILIAAFLVGAIIAATYTTFLITPLYRASSMIYVYSKTTSITSLADLQIGSQLTVDFQIIAKTRDVIEAAAKEAGVDATYDEVVKKVTISNPQNSRIIEIIVTDPNPEVAARLSNALANQLRNRIAEVMNSDVPSNVENAIVPQKPVSPSLVKNTAIGGLGLAFVLVVIFVISYLLDDTIKTEEDVERYLHQNVLAVVPLAGAKGLHSKKHKRNKAKAKTATA